MKANALPAAVLSLTFVLSTACERQPGLATGAETPAGPAALRARPDSPLSASATHIRAAGSALVPDVAGASEALTARVVLPGRANGQIHIEDQATGTGIDFALVGATNSVAQVVDGYVVYPKGHASGSIYQRAEPSGVEDYVAFDKRPASPSIAYDVALGSKVAGLRLVGNQLEMLDSGGVPRLRVAPPYVVGADDALTDALLAVEGCAVDTDPAGPWERKVTPPGARSCRVRISWSNASVVYPALLDPRWQTTGSLSVARQDHNLIYLPLTGKVLAVGGRSSPTSTTGLASAELYDKNSGTWSAASSMSGGRWSASATLLGSSSNGTTSQKVLIAGGINGTASVNTARLYNQTAGTWGAAGTLNAPRHLHTATLLNDGRVLVCGGMNGSTVLTSAAQYNPASGSGSWAATTGPIPPPGWRSGTATLIQTSNGQLNNKVLLAGGNNGTNTISAVFLFDPAQSAFSTLASMPSPREGHQVVTLSDGRILFSGGKNGSTYLASSVIFDPSWGPGNWTTAGNMTSPRWGHAINLIPSGVLHQGLVLVSGGSNGTSTLSSTEYWNGTNWATDGAMVAPVQRHGSVALGNSILIAGGAINNGSTTVSAAEVYDPSIALGCTSGSQCASGFCVSGVCCDSACNGGCGSCNLTGHLGICRPLTSGTVCRAPAEICDAAETCDGSSLACPANAYQPSTAVCRPSADLCDVAESCTGTSVACPADAFEPPTTVCRASAGACDLPETCTGTGTACPADTTLPAGTLCRGAINLCDLAEVCDGVSGSCPADASVQCSSIDQCHDAVCIPTNGLCANRPKPDGTPCDDASSACDHGDPSSGGTCVALSQERVRIQEFLDARYTANDIRHVFQSKFGEAIDCVDYFAQPGVKAMAARGTPIAQLPPPVTNGATLTGPFADVIFNGQLDQDGHPRACPSGSVPFKRLTVAGIEAAGGLDVLRVLSKKLPPPTVPACAARPESPGYRHVVNRFNTETFAFPIESVGSMLSIFTPTVAFGTQDHSLSQLWASSTGCHTTIAPDSCSGVDCAQTIEAGWNVDPDLNKYFSSNIDDIYKPHLFTFATPDGYAKGCYNDALHDPSQPNSACMIWIAGNGAQLNPGDVLPSGVAGNGDDQVEAVVTIDLVATGTTSGGATTYGWRLGLVIEDEFYDIGYWPSDQFSGDMQTKLATFQVGGEIYDSTSSWNVPMGSGQSPGSGYPYAAFHSDYYAFGHQGAVGMISYDFLGPTTSDSAHYTYSVAPASPPHTLYNYFYFGNASSP